LNFINTKDGNVCIVALSGRLDSNGSIEVEAHCRGLIECGDLRQLLDMTNVAYISSAGLRSLLVITKQIKSSGGMLALCCLTPMVSEVMKYSGFDKILTLLADRDSALARFNS
jgi:anti-anti-sigma factor